MNLSQEFEPRFSHPLPIVVAAWAEETPDAPFIIDAESGGTLTYIEADRAADRWACALASLGVGHADIVLTMLANGLGTVEAALGIQWRRAIEFAVHTSYRADMLADAFEVATPKIAIVDGRFRQVFRGIENRLGHLSAVVVVGEVTGWDDLPVQVIGAEELLSAHSDAESGGALRSSLGWSDVGIVHLTSGTTGPSKGVMQYWRQMYKTAVGIPGDLPALGQQTRWYSAYSMAAVAGRTKVYSLALLGGALVIRASFRTQDFWRDVRAYGCTHTLLVRTTANFVMSLPPSLDDRDHPLRCVQMAPLIGELDAFRERFGVPVYTCYNMTELSTPLVSDGTRLVDGESCGRARRGYELRISDTDDAPVPDGEAGELLVRTANPWELMAGYWGQPQATVDACRNQWVHTGDRFRRDSDGNYYFVDRIKDVIRHRGNNISSWELERAANSHPAVRESAAVGVPSELNEEDIRLVVVRVEHKTVAPHELVEFLRPKVASFMVPRYVEFIDDLPRSSSEKVMKSELRAQPIPLDAWDRFAAAEASPAAPQGASTPA